MKSHPHLIPLHPKCGVLCTSSDSYASILYPHHHAACEILLALEGVHAVILEQETLEIPAGGVMMIRPNEIHSRKMIRPGRYLTLAFPADELNRLEKYLEDVKFQLVLSGKRPPMAQLHDAEMKEFARRIERVNLFCSASPERVRTELRSLLVDCWCRYFLHPEGENPGGIPWLNRMMQEMAKPDNIREGISTLLSLSPYSHEYLCREFRRLLGCTPTEYIASLRLDRAHNLLETTSMHITDICFEVGFDSVSYFYQLFREKYGMPPAKYRKMRFIGRVDVPREQRGE